MCIVIWNIPQQVQYERQIIEISETVLHERQLPAALDEYTQEVCRLYDVDLELVYAIMHTKGYDPANNQIGDDGITRYGLMSIHPDLIGKSKEQFGFGLDVVESAYSNVMYGVSRLKWAVDGNESIEGALMAYYYTKPVAVKMWKQGIRTTDWVERVKGEL
jgi:hypothetical protein